MKKIISLVLICAMMLSTLSHIALAEEAGHVLFEDDFTKEAIAWKLEGSKWRNGQVELHTTGWQWARLVDENFLMYNPYTAEFDMTLTGGVDEDEDDWFSFTVGGIMFFYRLSNGTVHAAVNGGETKIGNAKLEVGKSYRMKVMVTDNYIALYYKDKDAASYRDIGVHQGQGFLPSRFSITAMMSEFDIDNAVFTSNGGNIVPDKKIKYVEVGQTDKITLTGPKAEGCTFESLNKDIASCESDGTVTAKKSGKTVVNVLDKEGNIAESVCIIAVQTPATLSFNYNPELNASVYKDSILYDKEKIKAFEGDVFDLRVYPPASATMKSIQWSVEPEGIVELWGTSDAAVTRTVTALKAGKCEIIAKSAFSDAVAKMPVEILPESQREIAESKTYDFYATGKTHSVAKELVGAHVTSPHIADKEEHNTSELVEDLGLHSMRTSTGFVYDSYYDPSKGETSASVVYRVSNATGVPIVCCLGHNMVESKETWDRDMESIVQYVKDIKDAYDGPLYIELFNEVFTYNTEFVKKFPVVDDYVEFCKMLVPRLKEVAPDAVYMACGIDYPMVVNITADLENKNLENVGDPAYTQAGRIMEWTKKVRTLVDEGYVSGITIHNYQSIGSHINGNIPKNNMKIRSAVVEMNYMGQLVDAMLYGYPDFYYTEWGQLEALIYWGPASGSPAEKIKYNYQKYPVAGLYNLAQLLNFTKTENAKMSHFHTLIGADGFGIVDDSQSNRNYEIPNEIVFKHMSKVLEENNTFYDLKPVKMDYVPAYRPYWNRFPEEVLQVSNVEIWGLGDENGIKQAAFFNQTDAPQKVKIGGTTLKPTWAYGGDTDKLLPDFLKNETYSSWNMQLTKDLANADEYTWKPETFEGADFVEEIEIPPYTILFADVKGTPQTMASSADKVSTLANYAMRNAVVLSLGKSNAYVDNVEKQIDTNPDVTPVAENGRTLLPLRFVAESFGCDVNYDGETSKVTVKNKNTEVVLTIGEKEYTVNGEKKEFDVPAKAENGRTLLPLRALAEALGKDVYWDNRGYIYVGTKSLYIDREIDYYFDEISKLYN